MVECVLGSMPVRGPGGLIRPLADQQLEINFVDGDIEYVIRGPFGVKRRFARPNPGATKEEMVKCMLSDTATSFAKGSFGGEPQNEDQYQTMLDRQQSYCEGVIEGIKSPPTGDSPVAINNEDISEVLGEEVTDEEFIRILEEMTEEEIGDEATEELIEVE